MHQVATVHQVLIRAGVPHSNVVSDVFKPGRNIKKPFRRRQSKLGETVCHLRSMSVPDPTRIQCLC